METESDRKRPGVGKAVLVVDDIATVRKIIVDAFRSAGFTCTEAENGKRAIEIAGKIKPDVIILDLSMPVMNGLEAAPELRKALPKTPIILFTVFGNALLEAEASTAGISLILPKSAPLSTLIDKAYELMSKV